jgi:hypothetical protein
VAHFIFWAVCYIGNDDCNANAVGPDDCPTIKVGPVVNDKEAARKGFYAWIDWLLFHLGTKELDPRKGSWFLSTTFSSSDAVRAIGVNFWPVVLRNFVARTDIVFDTDMHEPDTRPFLAGSEITNVWAHAVNKASLRGDPSSNVGPEPDLAKVFDVSAPPGVRKVYPLLALTLKLL